MLLHILAGTIGLASGALALYATKGERLHRTSGTVFVYAMLVMASSGAVLAALHDQMLSVVAGALTFYLVCTALLAVRRPAPSSRWIYPASMLVALAIGAAGVYFGVEALGSDTGEKDGFPAPPYFVFGGVALLAGLSDARRVRHGHPRGADRLARHLWRMCFALLIATASFFVGQPEVFPEPVREPAVLGLPVVVVLVVMIYWLVRVKLPRHYRRVLRMIRPA